MSHPCAVALPDHEDKCCFSGWYMGIREKCFSKELLAEKKAGFQHLGWSGLAHSPASKLTLSSSPCFIIDRSCRPVNAGCGGKKKKKKIFQTGLPYTDFCFCTKKVKIIGLGWGPGVSKSDSAFGHSNVGGPCTMLWETPLYEIIHRLRRIKRILLMWKKINGLVHPFHDLLLTTDVIGQQDQVRKAEPRYGKYGRALDCLSLDC